MASFVVVGKSKYVAMSVLQALRAFTNEPCFVVGSEETESLERSSLCAQQSTVQLDGSQDEDFVAVINRLFEKMPDLIIVPGDCDAIRITSRMRDRLEPQIIPIPELATLEMFDNKWSFHQFCVQHTLSVPEACFIGSKFDLDFDAVAAELGVPFMVKPLNQAGSFGIHVVSSAAEYESAIRSNPNYRYAPLIAQRYIDGVDIDLSLLSIGGELSSFAIQSVQGPKINFLPNAYLEKIAADICRLSGYHGVMHIDARIDTRTKKVYLIECNPRFWASLTASVWCGLNFVQESIRAGMAPSAITGVRRLTAGTAYTRNPWLRPTTWLPLMWDVSARGRLLRSVAFDPYTVIDFSRELPSKAWTYASKRIGAQFDSVQKFKPYLRMMRPKKVV